MCYKTNVSAVTFSSVSKRACTFIVINAFSGETKPSFGNKVFTQFEDMGVWHVSNSTKPSFGNKVFTQFEDMDL